MNQALHSNYLRCPSCNSIDLLDLKIDLSCSMRSDGLIQEEQLSKKHCNNCGLGIGCNSLVDRPYHRSNGQSIFDFARHKNVAKGLNSIFFDLTDNKHLEIFEVGAASFNTSVELKKINSRYMITAIEPHPESEVLPKDIEILITDFSKTNFYKHFDICFSNQVIEHIGNTKKFLEQCKRTIKDSGFIIICCPTSEVISHELLFSDHLYHFTKESILNFCNDLDLKLHLEFIAPWDVYTHVFVLRKEKNTKSYLNFKINSNLLFSERLSYFHQWSMQDELIKKIIDSSDFILYGAGEYSQLIRAYLPNTYSKVLYLLVDSLDGVRSFDKPVKILNEEVNRNHKILIGTHPNSKDKVREKLINFGFLKENILSLTV
jgi:SAM-dependent methyltransferase